MVTKSQSSPFGGSTRTRVLLALFLLTESYAREIARTLGVSHTGVLKAFASLERDGLVAGRLSGRTRIYRLDPRYFGFRELTQYLARLVEPEGELKKRVSSLRRRPRRSGKRL